MIEGSLATTNVLLGILAAVSVFEAIALVVTLAVGVRMYRRTRALALDLQRQVRELVARVNGLAVAVEDVVADVKVVTARTAAGAERAHAALGMVADTASLAWGRRSARVAAVAQGVRAAYRIFTAVRPIARHPTGPV